MGNVIQPQPHPTLSQSFIHSFIHSVSSTTSHHRHSLVLPSPVTGNIIQVSAATRDRGAKRVGVATKLRESCGEREILKQNCWSVPALSPAHAEEEDERRRHSTEQHQPKQHSRANEVKQNSSSSSFPHSQKPFKPNPPQKHLLPLLFAPQCPHSVKESSDTLPILRLLPLPKCLLAWIRMGTE